MQETLQNRNSRYFSICRLSIKLISLIIYVCLAISCIQNEAKQIASAQNQENSSESAININSASVKELEELPHIGARTAREIIEHREKFGKFRKTEHLMLVRGISDERFRQIRNLIKIE
jgi:comEA protein